MKALLTTVLLTVCTGAFAQAHHVPDAQRSGAAGGEPDAATASTLPSAPAAATARTIFFSGITWAVKNSAGALWGPGPNVFSDAASNVWVDTQGRLHLAITNDNGVWRSAEVIAQTSLGYGTYRYTLDTPVDALDANVVLGLFTWNDSAAYNHREIDIEFARWGIAMDPMNAQYTVQPYTQAGNQSRWTLPPGYTNSVHSFTWASRSVVFSSTSNGNQLKPWSYTRRNGVPRAGGENARINLWLFQGAAPTNHLPVEVTVTRFEFVP